MKFFRCLLRDRPVLRHVLACMLTFVSLCSSAVAYDNSVFPPFAITRDDRRFTWLSIHPDSERWLITECTDRIDPPRKLCYLFIYHRTNQSYQRLGLSSSYSYSYAQFSPDGQHIVAVRMPAAKDDSYEEKVRTAAQSEIIMMRADGQEFRVLGIPKGPLKVPVISPDETKVAYWSATMIRPEGSKTFTSNFDLNEFDLQSGSRRLFSGSFRFFLAGQFQYQSADQVVAHASGPFNPGKSSFSYDEQFNFSRLYCFDRKEERLQDPCLSDVPHASHPSLDRNGNLYLEGAHPTYGMSLFKISPSGQQQSWRMPRITNAGIGFLVSAPTGDYLGFIYSDASPASQFLYSALGYFDFFTERWISLPLPPPESALLIPMR